MTAELRNESVRQSEAVVFGPAIGPKSVRAGVLVVRLVVLVTLGYRQFQRVDIG